MKRDIKDGEMAFLLGIFCLMCACCISLSKTEEAEIDVIEQIWITYIGNDTQRHRVVQEEGVYVGIVEKTYDEIVIGFTKHRSLVNVDGEQIELTIDPPTYMEGDEVELEKSYWGKYDWKEE